jgi:hypothetical protein
VCHGGAGDGPAAPALSAERGGGVRARAHTNVCHGGEPALGLEDGGGSLGGLAHGGDGSMEGNQ